MAAACSECGHDVVVPGAYEAQQRIFDLQAQVKLLNAKASAAVDKLADYEDEIRSLRAQCAQLQDDRNKHANDGSKSLPPPPPPDPRQSVTRLQSLTSLLPGRRKSLAVDATHRSQMSDPNVPVTPGLPPNYATSPNNLSTPNLTTPVDTFKNPSPPPFATDPGTKSQSLTLIGLQSSLETERQLRQKAETNLTQAQTELEELTAQLFGQANEMVATERKARAKLEERVQLLETRDSEKRRRLERLEKAVERIERVRRMVVEHEQEADRRNEKMMLMKLKSQDPGGYTHGLDEVDEDEVYDEFEKAKYHEWDVKLKVWRRSKANFWRTPSFD